MEIETAGKGSDFMVGLSIHVAWWVYVIGFVLYFLFALAGVGAAIGFVPMLALLGIDVNFAKLIGLSSNFFSTMPSAVASIRRVWRYWVASLIGVVVGSWIAPKLSFALPKKTVLLTTGVVLLLIVFWQFLKAKFMKTSQDSESESHDVLSVRKILQIAVGTFLIALVASYGGIGGGALYIPFFSYILGGSHIASQVASTLVFTSCLVASVKYAIAGGWWNLEVLKVLLVFWVMAFSAGYLGKWTRDKLSPRALNVVLRWLVALCALLLIWKGVK